VIFVSGLIVRHVACVVIEGGGGGWGMCWVKGGTV
jgi:hypothetical protein